MGRASRWFKALFGIKTREIFEAEYPIPSRDKDRWLSGHLASNGGVLCSSPTAIIRAAAITPADAAWLRSFYNEPDDEEKQHARAVAAATAAAADAAMAAAQAAAMVVHLTARTREKLAVAKIQAAFRGYLARRALRALKGLVKIQALARGFLVRKKAAAVLYSMQSLIRAQERVRAQKARRSANYDENFPPARKSLENFVEHPTSNLEGGRSSLSPQNPYEDSPKIVEIDMGCGLKSRSKRPSTSTSDSRGNNSSPFLSRIPKPECKNLAAQKPQVNLSKCYLAFPNYNMVNQKVRKRSQSAPKERPGFESNPHRRLSFNELMESRNSYPGVVRTPRLSRRPQDMAHFKDALIGKLGGYPNFVEERVSRE